MNKIIPSLLLILLSSCGKPYPYEDDLLPPGTFNLSTVIVDANGNSLDLAGDWAVFQTPIQTSFTNFIHYDQTSRTVFSVTYNTVFMMEYEQGRESLPSYDRGTVDRPRSIFVQGTTDPIIYKNGRIHNDYRDYFPLFNSLYGSPDLHVVLDDDTLTYEDLPDVRLRRIKSFEP